MSNRKIPAIGNKYRTLHYTTNNTQKKVDKIKYNVQISLFSKNKMPSWNIKFALMAILAELRNSVYYVPEIFIKGTFFIYN